MQKRRQRDDETFEQKLNLPVVWMVQTAQYDRSPAKLGLAYQTCWVCFYWASLEPKQSSDARSKNRFSRTPVKEKHRAFALSF